MDSWDGARCAANRYLKTRASVDYLHSTSSTQDAEHKLQDPRHKDVYFSQAYHGVLCSRSPLSRSLVVYSIDELHKFSLYTIFPYQRMPCQLRSRILAVHNSNVTWHLAPHWLYANSSRAHENRARVSRPFLPRAGDAIHPALRR